MIAMIVAVSGFFTTALGILNAYLIRLGNKGQAIMSDKLGELEKNTNSIKDELVKVTGDAAFEAGRKVGEAAATAAEVAQRSQQKKP
jgi:hypothetical protein